MAAIDNHPCLVQPLDEFDTEAAEARIRGLLTTIADSILDVVSELHEADALPTRGAA